MHIPDNFLSTPVWAALDVVAAPAVALVSRRARCATDTSRLPLLGVMGAFVFAAQMVNFPVAVGTSGHLVGGTLLACVLGPEAAVLVITSILVVQSLIFQDGGVLALGANIFNMALCGVLAGYLPYSWFQHSRWKYRAVFAGGVFSVLASGLLALAELTMPGIRMPAGLLLLSVLLFLVNAVMEGAITATVLRAIERMNPELSAETPARAAGLPIRSMAAIGVTALVLGSIGLLIASSAPDGLEHLASRLGIAWNSRPLVHAPFADYAIPALGSGPLSRASAGFLGIAAIYMACLLGSRLLARGRRTYSA
jgi:cobalt/nickel transport system permease protein